MYELSKMSTNYRSLAAQGVTISQVTCVSYGQGIWQIKCLKNRSLDRAKAKMLVARFTEDEWEAIQPTFWVNGHAPENDTFFCQFFTWNL